MNVTRVAEEIQLGSKSRHLFMNPYHEVKYPSGEDKRKVFNPNREIFLKYLRPND